MNNLALIFIEEGRFGDALAPLARAVELRDDVAVFRNNLGMALENEGHYRKAAESYQAAVTIDETYEKAYANFERTDSITEDPGIEPVDLAALARAFVDEIESWSVAEVDTAQTDTGQPDSLGTGMSPIVVSEAGPDVPADTTVTGQDR